MSQIKRIAMLSVHTCPLAVLGGKKTGGMNVYVRELSRELGRRGIQVDVFTRHQSLCIPHFAEMLGENARVIHIPAGPELPLDPDQVYPYVDEFATQVIQFAERESLHYDVIYSHYWLSGVVAEKLRTAWNVPFAQLFHTLGMMKDRIAYEPSDYPTGQRAHSEAEIMAKADRIIAATPVERAQMLWLYRADRHRIEVVSPGVDLSRFHPITQAEAKQTIGLPLDHRLLLFVGRIEPLKGVDTILCALGELRRQAPTLMQNLSLGIIGGDPDASEDDNREMARLKALRQEMGLQDYVSFLGAKDQTELHNYYAAAEALIMPSDYESFGMVALEAMASGTPVIASNVGGLAYLVQDGVNGYHIPVRDWRVLAEKMRLLLQDPTQRLRLGQAANQTAQHYGWNYIADRLLQIFEHMLARQGATSAQQLSI